MKRSSPSLLLGIAMSAVLLAGCGQAGSLQAASSANLTQADMRGARFQGGQQGFQGDRRGPGAGGALFELQALSLTDAQKTQLKAIAEKYRAAAPAQRPDTSAFKDLKDVLSADTIDDAKLRSAIQAVQQARASFQPPSQAAMLTEVRALLTDDQRAKLVADLQARAARRPSPRPAPSGSPAADRRARLEAKLNLTADQKAAVDAFLDKLKANREANKPADREQAMITFWQTGDASGLAAPKPADFPVEEFVKAAESLNATQRKALLSHGLGFGGRHGGKRGHGERHGHGERGGFFGGQQGHDGFSSGGPDGRGPRAPHAWPAPDASGTASLK